MNAPQSGEALLTLLTLSHPSLTDPIRVVNDAQDLVSDGVTFQAFPFEVAWPTMNEDGPTAIKLRICNVDQTVARAVRSLAGQALTVTIALVLASAPDNIEMGPVEATLRNAVYEAGFVEGDLRFEDLANEPFPYALMTPARFPGLRTVA